MNALELAYLVREWAPTGALLGVALTLIGVGCIRRGSSVPVSDEELLDTAYAVGVVRIGDR